MLSTKRFSNRVENYVKYRPSYSYEMVDYLLNNGITNNSIVCDIGAGTGILSKLLISKVRELYAVEPNNEMLEYANKSLAHFKNYKSIQSTAENTRLPDSSIDVITTAQAFHWFDREKCKTEFKRILKPNGNIFIIWNNRINNTPFLEKYDALLYKYGTDYAEINHQNITDDILKKFINKNFNKAVFKNYQEFNLKGFLGRVFSSSYTPSEDHKNYNEFLMKLKDLFEQYNVGGKVNFNYQTEVYSGCLI